MLYKTPDEYFFRLHHIRPRFKANVETVLLFMANEIAKIPKLPTEEFKKRLNNAIKLFPKNVLLQEKTINNWRTEIAALFGFIQEDNITKLSWPGEIALKLAKEQDLVQFFKYFLFYFQYPGGHLKNYHVKNMIDKGVKFKPTQYILKLLEQGEKMEGKSFGITKAELTHLVFNDLRVTRDNIEARKIVEAILENRRAKVDYSWEGDTIRYAGDIIDYMVIANFLIGKKNNRFYINWAEREVITAFIQSDIYFQKYDKSYQAPAILKELHLLETDWFN